ncbi:MAG: lipopolysaccharide biosynthesis protein [Bacilli bacterium]
MKNNNIFKHFITIGIGTFLNMVLAFISTPIITRIVSPSDYGQYSLFTTYSSIALMVLCLGMDQALVRFYYEEKTLVYKKKLLFNCLILPFVFSLLIGLGLILLNSFDILKIQFNKNIVLLLVLYTFLQVFYRFSQLVNRLEFNTKLYSLLNVLIKVFYLVFSLPMLLIIKSNYLFILALSITISTFLCLIISILANNNLWKFNNTSLYEKGKMKVLIKYSFPYIFSMGITTLFQAIDKLTLNYYSTYENIGIYSSAIMIVNIFAIVQTAFNTIWAPSAMEHYANDNNDTTFYIKGNQIITLIMFFIGINIIFFKDILVFFLGSEYREAAFILPFLIFYPIMYTISETTVNGINFKKKTKLHIFIALGACLTNIVGNIILVPKIGPKGAAISTGISYIIFFTLRTLLSNKYFYVDFKLKKFYFITLIVSLFALYNTFNKFNYINISLYLISLILLIVLYKDSLKYAMNFLKNKIRM